MESSVATCTEMYRKTTFYCWTFLDIAQKMGFLTINATTTATAKATTTLSTFSLNEEAQTDKFSDKLIEIQKQLANTNFLVKRVDQRS